MENNSSISSSKYIRTVVLAGLVTFVVLNVWLEWLMPHIDSNNSLGRKMDYTQIYRPADILFIGDSRTHLGMDPNAFEAAARHMGMDVQALNLAVPGMQGPFYYFLFKEYLERVPQRPKAVIANISFYMLGGDQWFQDIYRAYYTPSVTQMVDAVGMRLQSPRKASEWYIKTRIPVLRYRKRALGLIDVFAGDPLRGLVKEYNSIYNTVSVMKDLKTKGYFSGGTKAMREEDIKDKFFDGYKIGFHNGYSAYQEYFKRFFEMAARYRIHVIIYPYPWPKKAMQNENFRKTYAYYDAMVKDWAKDNPYVHFVDYDYFWDAKYFFDELHINQLGADRLAPIAACWLPQHGIVETDQYAKFCYGRQP